MADPRKLQVFVSSTYSDLIEERGAAVAAILKAGHIPAGMELFSAGDKSQLDVIKAWIDESDVYMLILGTRYGSIEPISGLSYTEVEYDYAISISKPLFALVMGDEVVDKKLRQTGSAHVEKSNPKKLQSFKDKVLSKVCSIYEDNRDIKAHIYESLIDFSKRSDLIGWVRGDLIIDPKPLHARIGDLVTENERLKSDLSDARAKSTGGQQDRSTEREFEDLRTLLKGIKRTIPADMIDKGEDLERNIFSLFGANRSYLAAGVRLTTTAPARMKWFETHIYSVLVRHRLLQIDRRTNGDRYYSLTERGLDFAGWIDVESAKKE